MFFRAYDGYLEHAYPYDELRPLSCDGVDTWGSYSLTLIDSLDTLAIMGNYSEFRRVYSLLSQMTNFDTNINVSVFETNIRIVGGLLSAHLLAKRAGVDNLEPGWPCNGALLRLAEDVALRLLPAFDTPTGMPYGTVNLRHGVPKGETSVTCTAGVATFAVEFGALSRLTGNPVFEAAALRALQALWAYKSSIGLVGNHIDVSTGKWTATDSGIGAGVDSYYEYLVKAAALLSRPELMKMFVASREAIEQYLRHDDWHFWASMKAGSVTMPVFQSLEAFWPGLLSLTGDTEAAMRSMHNYHQVWKQYGALPEFYNVAQNSASAKREGYPLRPELAESAMYLYRATKDPFLLTVGQDMLESIEHSAKTECGYATFKDVRDHTLEDRMESFFLAETTKYLYLLFDPDNFVHNSGNTATIIQTPHGKCILDAGGYIFNTEAHPVDPAALNCCSGHTEHDLKRHILNHMLDMFDPSQFQEFQGDLIPARIKQIEEARLEEADRKRQKEVEYNSKMEEQRTKEREHVRKKKELEERRKKKQVELAQKAKEEEQVEEIEENEQVEKVVLVNSSSVMDLEYDFLEEENNNNNGDDPQFSEVKQEQSKDSVETNTQHQEVLIKRQSKDETIEPLVVKQEELLDATTVLETINEMFKQYLPSGLQAKAKFDVDEFTSRLLADTQYPINASWKLNYSVMSCPAQTFVQRFTVQGEFFEPLN